MRSQSIKSAAQLLAPYLAPGLTALEIHTLVLHVAERATAECTCSSLSYRSEYRCVIHPNVTARTPSERMDFEAEFDRKVVAG